MQSVTPARTRAGLGSSGFARRYSRNRCFFLFLRLLRCFSSGGSPRTPMDSVYADWASPSRVAPFGDLRINGYLLLPEAYRSLSRPSSAPDAKAFPLRSFQLDLLVAKSALLRFRSRENSARSLAPRFSPKTSFRRSGTGVTVLLRVVREFLVLFENYAGLQRSKLYVTLHPFECCSTINLLHHAFA